MFYVKADLGGTEQIIQNLGLQPSGPVQKFLTRELMNLSDEYVPFRNGPLKNSARPSREWDAIIYEGPYARYHWFGKLMVDPITGKGAFYDPKSGRFWSRPEEQGIRKVLTDRDLKYTNGPLRGPRWVERCWIDHKDELIKGMEKLVGGTK
jgi:hypothetical protein